MKENSEILKLIESYLEGELSDTEKVAFEQRLKTDEDLAKHLQLHQEVDLALGDPKSLEMENILSEIGDEFSEKYQTPIKEITPPTRNRFLRPLSIAASLILLAAVLWWQFGNNSSTDPQQLFTDFYQPYSVSNTIRSTNGSPDSKLADGQKKYQDKNYKEAISIFEDILKVEKPTSEQTPAVHFFKGLSHLELDEYMQADDDLNQVLNISNHTYTQQAQWYLALIKLNQGQTDRTIFWLKEVLKTSTNGKFAEQARQLLEALENSN